VLTQKILHEPAGGILQNPLQTGVEAIPKARYGNRRRKRLATAEEITGEEEWGGEEG